MKPSNNMARLVFFLSSFWLFLIFLFCIFVSGVIVGNYQVFPYDFVVQTYRALTAVKEQLQQRPQLLEERRYQGDGVTRYNSEISYEGVTLIQGRFAEGVELRLISMGGLILHRWQVPFFTVWPDPKHVVPTTRLPSNNFGYHTHGMWAFPDGSVVFNFAELGTVKVDKCGAVEWTVDRMTHHSITHNPDGSFWIPVKGDVRNVPDALLLPNITRGKLLKSRGWYSDHLLLVDSRGSIVREFSLLQALFDGGFERELYDAVLIDNTDPTHLNDIEVVTSPLADKIVGVDVGDLLVSIRNMHMLAILDQNNGSIKWHKIGPWLRQHDPDITPHGNILIFNNGSEEIFLNRVPGSNLIIFDPSTDQYEIVFPTVNDSPFFTNIMGASQILPNGNILVVESLAGRIFEIDRGGSIVWEYLVSYDKTYSALIESAIRFPFEYFEVESWNCNS